MPSMKWIREKTNRYLQIHHERVQTELDAALYSYMADTVSELVMWLEAMERIDKMAKESRDKKK